MAAYREFGRLHDSGVLLPSDDERSLARGDHFVVSAISALRQARVNADNDPDTWCRADAPRPDGSFRYVGRLYADREVVESEGEYITRFLLLLRAPPSDVRLRRGWQQLILAHVFESDDPVLPTYDLPPGTQRQAGEMPFKQESVELLEDEDTLWS
jgi:hypothetical protein